MKLFKNSPLGLASDLIESLQAEVARLTAEVDAAERERDMYKDMAASRMDRIIQLEDGAVARLTAERDRLRQTVSAIAAIPRFDRNKFQDDEEFIQWARSLCRGALEAVPVTQTTPAPPAGNEDKT